MADRPGKLLAAVEAAWWLIVAGILLKLLPLRLMFRSLPPDAPAVPTTGMTRARIERVRLAVSQASRALPWHPRCLPSAVAGVLMCRVRGLRVPIALGVTNRGGGFGAHARLDPASDMELTDTSPEGRTHLGRLLLTF